MVTWTLIQKQRLQELNASEEQLGQSFNNEKERNSCYQETEKQLVSKAKEDLERYRSERKEPPLVTMEAKLSEALVEAGFSRVSTPILLSRGLLEKMQITEEHSLFKQVFWIDEKKCLRPMLAPNLYYLLKDLLRIWEHPVSIFEIGPCFRKDTQGSSHLQEFTMLNLVEMGLPEAECKSRLEQLAALIMSSAGLNDYDIETESSEVYGSTIDVVAGGCEAGSGAIGPHPLDSHWGVDVPWAGIGFGLERLVMLKEGYNNIQKAARSLTYLNGIRLNI